MDFYESRAAALRDQDKATEGIEIGPGELTVRYLRNGAKITSLPGGTRVVVRPSKSNPDVWMLEYYKAGVLSDRIRYVD
ncbi:hypothetical protein FLK61_39585 [Paenalkalicoccus suaedae]|uniref:Uncharacterized protein n=1 Tax=Paenalkalicoccus suaedae TaxID=2592382 RepID=A0A859FIK9_9BACI|nr:hypothetical protein [Paenalkalicoccus suaedae]QKS72718.1 hypothetical protein FLK61_39585 [Paenalkalicoccus suaedae]